MISECYAPADWSDTSGPGCGVAEHGDDCLCDVNLDDHPVPLPIPGLLTRDWSYAQIALDACRVNGRTPDLLDFSSELLGLVDALGEKVSKLTITPQQLNELRSRYLATAHGPLLFEMRRGGLSLRQIAAFVGISVLEAARCLTRGYVNTPAFVTLDDRIADGEVVSPSVARECGLTWALARHYAMRVGAPIDRKAPHAEAMASRRTLSPETNAEIFRLREQGLSYQQIGRVVDVTKANVAYVLNREKRLARRRELARNAREAAAA